MKVNAIVVTRGDVDLSLIFDSFSAYGFKEGEVLVWNNSIMDRDLSVYGRYAAITRSSADLIYVQDDDVVLPSESIAQIINSAEWVAEERSGHEWNTITTNMPQEFRHEFYEDHALVGFGACFHRDAPATAFANFFVDWSPPDKEIYGKTTMARFKSPPERRFQRFDRSAFYRTCDIVFTALTPRVLVDVPKENLPWAEAPNRMWMQPEHQAERARMLEIVKEVRG